VRWIRATVWIIYSTSYTPLNLLSYRDNKNCKYFFFCSRYGSSKKWHSLRNCFARELRLQKETKSGQGAKKRRKYIYFAKLLFLPSVENRGHRGNLDVRFSLSDTETESEVACEAATGERREYGRRRKPATQKETYEESLLKILEQKKTRWHRQGQYVRTWSFIIVWNSSLLCHILLYNWFLWHEIKEKIMHIQIFFPSHTLQFK